MAKILAISSGGGHWEQLVTLKSAFGENEVVYANTIRGLAEKSHVGPCYLVSDCNRDSIIATIKSTLDVYLLLRHIKPDLIISTGAAPGLISLFVGKLFGAKTIWIDSVANSERLSLSGKLATMIADLHITQWRHLSSQSDAKSKSVYMGNIL